MSHPPTPRSSRDSRLPVRTVEDLAHDRPSPPYLVVDVLRPLLIGLYDRLRSVNERMSSLVQAYRRCIPASRLGIKAWGRKGEPPRALYWIFLVRRRWLFDDRTLERIENQRPRWYHRQKVNGPNDLEKLILHACLGAVRANVHRFGRDVAMMNQAHRALARGLHQIKHILSGRAAGGGVWAPPPPEGLVQGTPAPLRKALHLAWALECRRQRTVEDMKATVRLQGLQPGCGSYRMRWLEEQAVPFGTLEWIDAEARTPTSPPSWCVLRRLRVPRSRMSVLAPFERNRKELERRAERLKAAFFRAFTRARVAMLDADESVSRLQIDPLTEPRAVTEDRSWF